ncbi:hypothetical protein [Paenibacillus sp. 1781tsa1]|uniref:hypothetical protein n=1 Tax=Paenibacillus sp. 1781tsa1 TaxID=2953810 RepID=UPI0020A228C9|nr:hypothetical protein [Paenibacillus sp. 1781tsa1]MCP1182983.1 hypothetical protein [Paenibacillus sp. 1781tsa1]
MSKHHFVIENKSRVNGNIHTSYSWDSHGNIHKSGLNNCGITVIEEQDALLKFHQLIQAWIDLFSHATDPIVLTGSYGFDGEEQKGCYEKLLYNKVELINELHKLANMAKYAEVNGKCIVHFGI